MNLSHDDRKYSKTLQRMESQVTVDTVLDPESDFAKGLRAAAERLADKQAQVAAPSGVQPDSAVTVTFPGLAFDESNTGRSFKDGWGLMDECGDTTGIHIECGNTDEECDQARLLALEVVARWNAFPELLSACDNMWRKYKTLPDCDLPHDLVNGDFFRLRDAIKSANRLRLAAQDSIPGDSPVSSQTESFPNSSLVVEAEK